MRLIAWVNVGLGALVNVEAPFRMARLEIDRTVLRVWAILGVAAIPFFAICGYRIEAKV